MSFFIDKHGRRKSPIALAACGAALLDLLVYFGTAWLLAEPLYRAVSLGGEAVTSMLHTAIITAVSTLICCLLFLLKDKRVVPYGFAGLAVILLMFCAAAWMLPPETRGGMLRLFLSVGLPPVLVGNAVSWPVYRKLRKAHPEYFIRKTISEELKEAVEQERKKNPVSTPASAPVQTPEPDISPTEALFGPENSGAASGAFHNAQDEAMLFYEDDDDES